MQFNADNAIKIFHYLKNDTINLKAINDILILPATQLMIAHDGKFDDNLTANNFKAEISNPLSQTDAFRFKKIRKNLDKINHTINVLSDSLDYITRRIQHNLSLYAIEISDKPVKMFFILGGNSDGYTTDENTFNVELQYFGDDLEGMITLITHELYHILQSRARLNFNLKVLKKKDSEIYNLLDNVYLEGTASFIAEPLKIDAPKKYSTFLQKKYERNLNKIDESFYLLESILSQIIQDPTKSELWYNVGFGGKWDSPFYFVGYLVLLTILLPIK